MQLSIVIVNYNVKHFLSQCLTSVFEACKGIDTEVFVVDNNSVDGSVEMVNSQFPQVKLIANKDNPGFAKANNQAIKQSSGDYVLLLNPDTLVEKDTFTECLHFMENHPDCGGLGVKMINGEGIYLKESKRGFPTPETSFYKLSGLIKLFPHHPKIAAYYMGNLDENEINEIEILPGAFLMISREALDKVGLLDESYFMYGEDIDFSWRIKLAGYKNYYLPTTRIIHYKGESTKKGSMNYVYTFYNAMVIFTQKYFSGNNAKLFTLLLKAAIWGRASLAFLKRIAQSTALPLADFILSMAGFLGIKHTWATFWAENVNYYPAVYTWAILPLYVLILMISSWISGGYDKPIRLSRPIKGIAVGAFLLLAFYSLLDETQRYSRAVLILGSIWTLISSVSLRSLLSMAKVKGFQTRKKKLNACIIVGGEEETTRVKGLYEEIGIVPSEMLTVSPSETSKLDEMIRVYRAEEVIFCSKDLNMQHIINLMQHLKSSGVEYKIAPEESDFVIGSNSINTREDIYTYDLNTISTPMSKRNKQLFDFFSALLFLTVSPILFWMQKRKRNFFGDCIAVLSGKKSWVGNSPRETKEACEILGGIKQGIFIPSDILPGNKSINHKRINLNYAKNYRISTDIAIVWRNILNL